jgi:DNA-directed RNA polymerase subunit RPC12/RpoP
MLFKLVVSAIVIVVVMRIGIAILRALATPVPEPPPSGELRKVNLRYRCALCGAEVRMTAAAEQEPEPPRHCMEEMELVAAPE